MEEYFVTKYEDRFHWDTPENLAIFPYGAKAGWEKYGKNPVLGGEYGTCFDLSVLEEDGKYKMWFSWRPHECIAYSESEDGLHWSEPIEVLKPNPNSTWDRDELNRPSVIKHNGVYMMWYSGQMSPYTNEGRSVIGYAESIDGINWKQKEDAPVMEPDQEWEKHSIMCPHVIYEDETAQFKMWYSGGGNHEPDAIGYAVSSDGLHWDKNKNNPIMKNDPQTPWERDKVAACHTLKWNGYYYMFYIGFVHVDRAAIGLARSKDGITNWERHPQNPIIAPDKGTWDDKAVYKPYILKQKDRWIMWYNGAMYVPDAQEFVLEQIGVAFLNSEDLWNSAD
jgi:predicted GH43/DUF377 family glycosyl hydrolase